MINRLLAGNISLSVASSRPRELASRCASSLARRITAPPASLAGRVWLVAVNLAVVTFFLLSYVRHRVRFGRYRIDLNVYRIGGRVWMHHGNLYGVLPLTRSGARLPFSYPPFAAALLSPLSMEPMVIAGTALTLASVAVTAAVLMVFLRSVTGTPAWSWWTVAWLLPVALSFEPVWNTLDYGQVNAVLMVLVSLDCLVIAPRWPRGALVGLAAAVKLTPGAFVLFFLLRRDWRAAATAAASFIACTAAGFLLAWHDSVRYWTSIIFHSSRPGDPAYAANQSLLGVLARAGLDPHAPVTTAVWLALSGAIVAVACLGMRRALACGADAWALCLNALAGLLVSPISWSHHWVWCAPALLTLAILSWRHGVTSGLIAAGAGAVMFVAGPQWWLPHGENRELQWTGWEQAVGNSYVIFAAVLLVASAIRHPSRHGHWKNSSLEGFGCEAAEQR